MLERFYPKEYLKSAYELNYEELYRKGYRCIVFDIDNTLVCHDEPATGRASVLMKRLTQLGFHVCLVSNNKEERVKLFADQIGVPYISKAHKPSRSGFQKAMQLLHMLPDHTVSVGDQIFTDVYGANRAGLYSILVQPINKKEEAQIVLKRYFERIVLYFYKRRQVQE